MIVSRSVECAFSALVTLAAEGDGAMITADRVAAEAGLPAPFVAKLLQQMARVGWVRSTKGPAGGFTLTVPAETLSIYDIALAFDGARATERCPMGSAQCSDQAPCGVHQSWGEMRRRIVEWMQMTTVAGAVRPAGKVRPARPANRRKAAR